jgi:hypothetical protein
VREELEVELEGPALRGVFECAFVHNGIGEHEIVFVYTARFTDASLYERTHFDGVESNGVAYVAEWVRIELFASRGNVLFPNELFARLKADA